MSTQESQRSGRGRLRLRSHPSPPGVAALRSGPVEATLAPLASFGDAVLGLLVTALAHHGRPVHRDSVSPQATPWRPAGNLDPLRGVTELVNACQRWFPRAFAGAVPLPDDPRFENAFAGLVMLSDWIGSDPDFFRFSTDSSDRMPFARGRSKEIVARLFLDIRLEERRDALNREPFSRVSEYSPNDAQRALVSMGSGDVGSGDVV